MKLAFWRTSFAIAAFAYPVSTYADPVTLISAQLYVTTAASSLLNNASTDEQFNRDSLASVSTATSDTGWASASASMVSTVSAPAGEFSGTVRLSATNASTSAWSGATAASTYLATFDVLETRQFSFSGIFTSTGRSESGDAYWGALLYLLPVSGIDSPRLVEFSGSENRSVTETGLIGPGRYGLIVESVAETYTPTFVNAATTQQFRLTFSDVPAANATPEPTSILLFGTGLAGTLVRRRRNS